jgi:hypothetical protein
MEARLHLTKGLRVLKNPDGLAIGRMRQCRVPSR